MNTINTTLPHQTSDIFLSDGGLETWMIFIEGIELPEFASFDLLKDDEGLATLARYYRHYIEIARSHDVGFIFDAPTWRGNSDWATKIGYDRAALDAANRKAITFMQELRDEARTGFSKPMPVNGAIGPRDDGYNPGSFMSADTAQAYHAEQISSFRAAGADMVTGLTMTYVNEAVGIARAAKAAGIPVVISFTTETDGNLPDGTTLKAAIETTDAATDSCPAYYMINCAHPGHFDHVLEAGEKWVGRIKGLRANASTKSHAELDEAEELDAGDPEDFARRYLGIRSKMPHVTVMGGCCGTDHRHIGATADACLTQSAIAAE
jgi:S-methylmethionine-dependent homocysteine/selenocysteine methylase